MMKKKKILCAIDHFGSGGAQRQMITLIKELHKFGNQVEVFIYYPDFDFFRSEIDYLSIKIHSVNKKTKGFSLNILRNLRIVLKQGNYDAVISFLDTPNIYVELASLGVKNTKVIVSERNSYLKEHSQVRSILRRFLHILSYRVVCNSYSQTKWIKRNFLWLKGKAITIYNGYNPDNFFIKPLPPLENKNLKLIGIGRLSYQKNQHSLIKALDLFYQKHGWCPEISWVGNLFESADHTYKNDILDLLKTFPHINAKWQWLGERSDIAELLSKHHALILPSIFEGLPNVVCEAFFCGRPVLAANVCDNPILIGENERGFLFSPLNLEDMQNAIFRFSKLTEPQLSNLSRNSSSYAYKNLTSQVLGLKYQEIINE